ncbi:MAG TPA: TIR domain-containing protein [Thermoanaerobaculia bacterium]|jgi:CheY-like chemotaxis protein|nr:TIR domain-containing protein [Thermoanaerobaculia bacterium]
MPDPLVFLSHSSSDKAFVRRLAEDLRGAGVPVWFDEWELRVGDSLSKQISSGLERSSFLIFVVSEASLESQWASRELAAATSREISETGIVVIPLLISGAKPPILLADKIYADFRSSYPRGLRALLRRLASLPNYLPEASPKILWLDNDVTFIASFCQSLRSRGGHVDIAKSPLEADEHLSRQTYHLVIIDIMIPTTSKEEEEVYTPIETQYGSLTGLVFFKRNQAILNRAGTKVIFLTVRASENVRHEIISLGVPADQYITKLDARRVEGFIDKIEDIIGPLGVQISEKEWQSTQVKRAHSQLASECSREVLAGAQTLVALGAEGDRNLIQEAANKWVEEPGLRVQLESVLRFNFS